MGIFNTGYNRYTCSFEDDGGGGGGQLVLSDHNFHKKGLTLVQIIVSDLTMDAQLDKEWYVAAASVHCLYTCIYIV